jgi:hypothetical protein
MLQITTEFKEKIASALFEDRKNFDGSDTSFAKKWSINAAVYNRIKKGERSGLLKDAHWMEIARELDVTMNSSKWKLARTDVFNVIEEDINFCKENSKSRICVDDCGIGKTYSAKYISRKLTNCFYIDGSQAKTKQQLIRTLAKEIGINNNGRYIDVKEKTKYYLKSLPKPMVIIDEAGDLDYTAFLELKEMWNATDHVCGWYLMGADGLRAKITRGINNEKVGFKEMFSRHSEKYTTIVPPGNQERLAFYRRLITDVLSVNMDDPTNLTKIVNRCLTTDGEHIGGLRRAESLLILNAQS